MRRRLAVLLASALALSACGGGGGEAEPTASPSPSVSASPMPEPSPPDEATSTFRVWFARSTPEAVWVEPETQAGVRTMRPARQAFEHLLAVGPENPDLETLAPEGTRVLDVEIADGVLTLDLSAEVDPADTGFGSSQEVAFAQQLAHTATQFDGVEAVRLLLEGAEVTDLWGHLDWSRPVEPDPLALTPITIENPPWGWRREGVGPLTATGQANTFEATLAVRLIDPDGEVVEEQWITATSGSGTRGTWTHTFAETGKRGTWTIEAEEPDPSGGAEGRPPLVVRTEFRLT